MSKKLVLAFMAIVLASASSLSAQGTAHGITKQASRQSDLVEFCASGAHKEKFNISSCDEIVSWFNSNPLYKKLGIKNAKQMSEYVKTLNVEHLPAGNYAVNREVNGKILLEYNHPEKRFMRTIQEGDLGLYDNNLGMFVFLSSCFNSPYFGIPVHTAMAESQPPKHEQSKFAPGPSRHIGTYRDTTVRDADFKLPPEELKSHTSKWLTWGLPVGLVAATGGVVTYALLHHHPAPAAAPGTDVTVVQCVSYDIRLCPVGSGH